MNELIRIYEENSVRCVMVVTLECKEMTIMTIRRMIVQVMKKTLRGSPKEYSLAKTIMPHNEAM